MKWRYTKSYPIATVVQDYIFIAKKKPVIQLIRYFSIVKLQALVSSLSTTLHGVAKTRVGPALVLSPTP